VVIEQAKGMVSEATNLEMDEAYKRLRDYVRVKGTSLASFSRAIAGGTINPGSFSPQALPHDGRGDRHTIGRSDPKALTITVCIVEDNRNLRAQLVDVLTEADVNVVAAVGTVSDGEAAIIDYVPHVAIIDNNLPDGRGIDLIRTLASVTPQVTLLLYSAGVTDEVATEATKAGATAVVAKSIHTDELLKAVLGIRPHL
jgi:CheY-like chemotaxis protein